MKAIALVGWSGSGKTTLIERLIPELAGRGYRVSTVKHSHHAVDLDTPGKDSWRHREAGAEEVMVVSGRRWALLRENRDAAPPDLAALLSRLAPVDLVLVEGFGGEPLPKIEVVRAATGKPLRAAGDPTLAAVACDEPRASGGPPCLDLNDPSAIADFIVALCGLR